LKDLSKIRLLITDVDGVLTDGRIIVDSSGGECKEFHVRDGAGLRYWIRSGHQAALLTGRETLATAHRAAELGITLVEQGAKDKLPALERLLAAAGCTGAEAVYVGDDLPDLPVMRAVGLAVAVADATNEVLSAADYVTAARGGQGAIREVVELVLKAQGRWAGILKRYC